MKKHILLIVILFFATTAHAADLTFSCLPNPETDLAGYRVYYGEETRNYSGFVEFPEPNTVDGGRVIFNVPGVADTSKFFAATAYDTAGNESGYSNEVNHDAPPSIPGAFSINISVNVRVTQ